MDDERQEAGPTDYRDRSEELQDDAEGLEREGSQIEEKAEETGRDWEAKKDDQQVPGAQRPSEELDEPQEEQTAEPEEPPEQRDDDGDDEPEGGGRGAGYEETGEDDSG